MPTDPKKPDVPATDANDNGRTGKPPISPAAERARAEATVRRAQQADLPVEAPKDAAMEVNGRGGLDPTRYGDWEINGLTSDF
jgi:hypothetical protein